MSNYKKISSLKSIEDFNAHTNDLGIELNAVEQTRIGAESPLGQSIEYKGRTIGNRWCVLPMEGWDCLPNGSPGELTERRWLRFARSGAKLLYGCEAAAVMKRAKATPGK